MTNSNNTKRTLLASALSLLLSLAMLTATTFAWFTDSVKSGSNKIVSGNLDVEFEYKDASGEWKPITADTNLFLPAEGENATLWEPGHTEYVQLRVRNAGTLSLKYDLSLNIYGDENGLTPEKEYPNSNGGTFKLSDYLVFNKIDSVDDPAAREDLWISDETAEKAAMGASALNSFAKASAPLAPAAEEAFTLAVYIPTWVGNDANYRGEEVPTIFLGLTLNATQYASESDSFDNTYDEDAYFADSFVASETELTAALAGAKSGNVIAIESDITLTGSLTIPAGVTLIGKSGATVTVPAAGGEIVTLSPGAGIDGLNFTVPAFTAGTANAVYMMNGSFVTGCSFTGAFDGGNEVSRGIAVQPGAQNIRIAGNTFDALRQPAYINNGVTGVISGNTVTSTKGFVVCSDSDVEFTGNSFSDNVVDIAIIASNTLANNYTDVIAISAANGCAFVENQVSNESAKPVLVGDIASLTSEAAKENALITLDPSVTYEGSFDLANGVAINGNGATVKNDGSANTFNIAAGNSATIMNVKIESQNKKYGIHVQPGAGDVTIEGCEITGTTATMGHAIWLNGGNSGNVVIKDCTISRPINFSGYNNTVSGITIENNTFTLGYDVSAVTLCGSLNNVVIRNNSIGGYGRLARIHKDGLNNFNFDNVLLEGNTGRTDILVDTEVNALYEEALANGGIVIR